MAASVSTHYLKFAAAYVRGRRIQSPDFDLPERLTAPPLDALSTVEMAEIGQIGLDAGLRLDRYKRANILPRVQKVLGTLQGIRPESLLDIGGGRGAFLWPFLDRFPGVPVTSIDFGEARAAQLEAVALGGLANFSAHRMDATRLDFADGQFDVVTALEVLEHIPAVETAVCEVCRAARRFVIASAPSKEDSNPEHIHLLAEPIFRELFAAAGVEHVTFEYVLNHRIAIARISRGRA